MIRLKTSSNREKSCKWAKNNFQIGILLLKLCVISHLVYKQIHLIYLLYQTSIDDFLFT